MRKRPVWLVLLTIVLVIANSTIAWAGFGSPNPPKPEYTPNADMPAPGPRLLTADPSRVIPGEYIVVFHPGARGQVVRAAIQQEVRQNGGSVRFVYDAALSGFAASLPERAVQALLRNPNIDYIEPDQTVQLDTTQTNATWGLDRIDQPNLPLNSTYVYNYDGTGVHAYIIDTGIRYTHNEFGGRATFGYDAIGDGRNGNDCNGHGTHVSGTVGGATYGVAKNVSLVAVRVLNCSGSGTNSGVIAGVNWVTNNHISPAVANMSLGGGASSALDTAVNNSINSGVTYAIAAGNSNANACNYSPARVAAALTVGATTSTDARASYSNYGTCLDLFAPGSSITSAWYTSNTATNTINGTSMATPHVAGVAALYLDANPGATPSQVASAIINNAVTGKVTNPGSGSPNRLLQSLFGSGPSPTPTSVVPTPTATSPGAPCTGCEQYTGFLSGTGDSDNHPNGTYYYSVAGNHRGWLQGPSGTDFDLYLYRWNGFSWSVVASSLSSSSTEYISYNGTAGYYYWKIYSYSGSGSYTFWLDRP